MQRIFIPGSEWLYLKVYTGPKSAENILINYLYPALVELKAKDIVRDFFFIRYNDPSFHIRFRIKIKNVSEYGIVFTQIEQILYSCVDNGLINNVQYDTYHRELERYGEQYISEVEAIFCIDSRSIINLLQIMIENGVADEDRWKLSLLLIDDLMSAFSNSIAENRSLMEQMSNDFKSEFGFTTHTYTKQLNDKYRKFRHTIENTLQCKDETLTIYRKITLDRKEAISKISTKFDYGSYNKPNLLYSLIHMTINRLFRSKNRLSELVIYDYLSRYYTSQLVKST